MGRPVSFKGKTQSLQNGKISENFPVFINNLENNLRESSPLDPKNIKKMKSLKLSNQKSEVINTYQKIEKIENDEKNFVSKKELVQKSQHLIMDLDIAQKEITKAETKSYAQGISPHDHRGGHHHKKNVSNHTKISENATLREIQEEEITDHNIPDLQSMTLKRIKFKLFHKIIGFKSKYNNKFN